MSPSASPPAPWSLPPRALVNVLLAAFTLRWIGLEAQSLWLDEGATWAWASAPTWGDTIFAEANHPPVWWIITRVTIALLGDGEQALRIPAALAGVATVFLAWRLGLRLFDPARAPSRGGFSREPDDGRGRRLALWFAGFVAASAYLIEVSQEARMYALLVAESLGLALLYLGWLDRGTRRWLVGYALLAALALHTHYFAIWPLAALAVHALFLSWRTARDPDVARRVPLAPFALANVAAGLLFLPWLLHLLGHYGGLAFGDPPPPLQSLIYVGWRVAAGPGLVVGDAERSAAGPSAVQEAEWPMILLVSALWLPPLLLGAVALRRAAGAASLIACALLVPALGLLAVFPWFPMIHERYLCFAAPWLWLLATVGALRAGRFVRPVLLAGLALVSGLGLVAYHGASADMKVVLGGRPFDGVETPREVVPDPADPVAFLHHGHPFGKEPWREARDVVKAYTGPSDLVVLYPGYLHLVWNYYARAIPGGPPPRLGIAPGELDAEALLAQHGALLAHHRRVALVLSHTGDISPQAAFAQVFKALGAAWHAAGAEGIEAIPPIPLKRSWGVHVALFRRKE
jgi:4-amino-4-deoxy-L-arabinose transferase-like glycosyltransferase